MIWKTHPNPCAKKHLTQTRFFSSIGDLHADINNYSDVSLIKSHTQLCLVRPHPCRIDRRGCGEQVLLFGLVSALLVGAVLLHGLPAGEMDYPTRRLLPRLGNRLLMPLARFHALQLHALKVLHRGQGLSGYGNIDRQVHQYEKIMV